MIIPETSTIKYRCLQCGNENIMSLVTEFEDSATIYESINNVEIIKQAAIIGSSASFENISNAKHYIRNKYRVFKCSTCDCIIIFKKKPISPNNKVYQDMREIEYSESIIYPIIKNLDRNIIPENIVNIYNEACSVKALSPNSYAMLIRKALEDVCDKHGAKTSDKIYEKLEDLAQKGIFPQNIIDVGHVIRKISRYGGHPKDEEVTREEADLLDDIFNLILEYVYVTPHKIKILEEKVNRTKNTN